MSGFPPVSRPTARRPTGIPFSLDRLTCDPATGQLTRPPDNADGPTASTQAVDPLDLLAQHFSRVPSPGQVKTRYCDWYASRTPGGAATPGAR